MANRLVHLLLFAVVAALVSGAWLRLEDDRTPLLEVLGIVGVALIPGLAAALTRRRFVWIAAIALSLLLSWAVAFRISLAEARPGTDEHDFFGPVFGAFRDGLHDFYLTRIPFDRLSHPEMEGLVLFSIYGFLAVSGLLIALRRTLAAGVVLLLAVGWPATLFATVGGNSLAVGAILLAALLVLLFLSRSEQRPLRGIQQAAALGAIVALAGVAAATSDAVSKTSLLKWQRWSPYETPKTTVGVRYVWSSNYRGLHWPEERTVVFTVKAPKRALYWRATTLDTYTGIGWRETLALGRPRPAVEIDAREEDPLLPKAAADASNLVRQEFDILALSDSHLIASTQPVQWGLGQSTLAQYAPGGVIVLPQGLSPGQKYVVRSYVPDISPKELVDLETNYPARIDRYLEVLPDVRFPRFGVRDREERVAELFAERADDPLLVQHQPLYERALEITKGVPSPYTAALGLEEWFRNSGGFEYDESPPPYPRGTPPLVTFVGDAKRGYCQQYAGAMALMLRMLGIPARVAAGFVSGEYDSRQGLWTVVDRDAHTWVEVYFPEYGWLPFDPTPGRGELQSAYSVASPDFDISQGGDSLAEALARADQLAEILQQRLKEGDFAVPFPIGTPEGGTPDLGGLQASEDRRLGIAALVFVVLGVALVAFVALKVVRRQLRFLTRDPRKLAAACRRDLVGFLADQGMTFEASATVGEIARELEARYVVDAERFGRSASRARFGESATAGEAARDARRDLKRLQRQLREELGATRRLRGLFRVRSLTA